MDMDWLQNILGMESRKDEDLSEPNAFVDESTDTTSSAAESKRRQDQQRDMRAELEAFVRAQKKLDADGDFTKQDRADALSKYHEQQNAETEAGRGVGKKDIEKAVGELKTELESNNRLLPYGGDEAEIIEKVDSRPAWAANPPASPA